MEAAASSNMRLWTLLIHLMCASSAAGPAAESRCAGRACNPRMGNLALGRVLSTQSVCGSNSSEPYCFYTHSAGPYGREACPAVKCSKCDASVAGRAHPPSAMSDSSFRHPDTWWQSAEGVDRETLQLDLETRFYFTHLILVFRSPRPATMVLERSQDHGHSWETLRYFARDCEGAFGMVEEGPEGEGATCTSKYSKPYPCTRGEVIYRALPPWRSLVDPYGPAAQAQLTVTNLRVRLGGHQACPCQDKQPGGGGGAPPTAHHAVYDFIVKGSCLCHGHAEHCGPAAGFRPPPHRTGNVVHGRCVCRHNTAGVHCERCAPLHNEQPWRAANGLLGTPWECRKCKCNGHARSCHLDRRLWAATRGRSGGVCDCQHNTGGRQCQGCRTGFYRDPARERSHPESCRPCSCHPVGSVLSGAIALCDPHSGACTCKPGVSGPHCDRCMLGYWGLQRYGCRPCGCTAGCDPYTGDCIPGSEVEEVEVPYTATGHMGRSSSDSERGVFRAEELFSALHHSAQCKCVEMNLGTPKFFCSMEYDYALMVRVASAHDRGSHAEVEVKVKKVLYAKPGMDVQRGGGATLYPASWTSRGCTCPVLSPGSEYAVAGHQDRRTGRLMVNAKSLVKAWRPSLGRKLHHMLRRDCGRR